MSRVDGGRKLKRVLRRLPGEMIQGISQPFAQGAQDIVLDARGFAPKLSGDMAASIEAKFSNRGLTVAIGPGVRGYEADQRAQRRIIRGQTGRISDANRQRFFQFSKGLWMEFGTKGSPEHNIPPLPPHPFMGPAVDLNLARIRGNVVTGINRTLGRVARGG